MFLLTFYRIFYQKSLKTLDLFVFILVQSRKCLISSTFTYENKLAFITPFFPFTVKATINTAVEDAGGLQLTVGNDNTVGNSVGGDE